jgi:hypothetical protein
MLAVGLRPCAAWMSQPEPEAVHDCCDDASDHSRDKRSDCELVCALAGAEFLPADAQKFDGQQLVSLATPAVVELAATVSSPPQTRLILRPPDPASPLYVLNAAFLL